MLKSNNHTHRAGGNIITVDFTGITYGYAKTNEEALYYSNPILEDWLPDGELRNNEYLALNPTRSDSSIGSFSINTNTGVWSDFAEGDSGVGFISLAAYLFDLDSADAEKKVAAAIKKAKASGHGQKRKTSSIENQPIVPVPDAAPQCKFSHPEYGVPTKLYAYRDKHGKKIMYEARWDYTDEAGKKQKQIRPITYCKLSDGGNGWRAKAPPKPYPLYQLDEIHADKEATIIICEGTKSAHAAQWLLHDYVCTTPVFGAQSPEHSDFSIVKDRVVIIWPDNDEAGADFAAKVVKLCSDAGAIAISVLNIPKDFSEKWDAADARAEGWTKDEAIAFLQKQQNESYRPQGLKVTTLHDFISKRIKPREMILSPIIAEKGAVMLHAYRGVGKTHVALGIAYAVATGTKFLKWTAKAPKRVLLVDGEMPEHTLQARLKALVNHHNQKPFEAEYFKIIAQDFQDIPMPSLSTPEGQAIIDSHLDDVSLLILDNLSTLCPDVKENDGDSWVPVQKWLLELRRRGIAVLLVHHSGKGKMQRGSSRKEDILETVIMLDRPEDYKSSEGARFTVQYEKGRHIFGDDSEPFEAVLQVIDDQAVWRVSDIKDAKADQLIELVKKKMSVRKIAEQMNMPHTTVQNHITKLKEQGKL